MYYISQSLTENLILVLAFITQFAYKTCTGQPTNQSTCLTPSTLQWDEILTAHDSFFSHLHVGFRMVLETPKCDFHVLSLVQMKKRHWQKPLLSAFQVPLWSFVNITNRRMLLNICGEKVVLQSVSNLCDILHCGSMLSISTAYHHQL